MINYASAKFEKSAAKLHQCPPDTGAEVAFAGRSNAGKSSAINAITGITTLARTSKTPGRTQLINFFSLDTDDFRLVDLPGYGYANVPEAVSQRWQRFSHRYLEQRHSLRGLILLMDIRHPLKSFDMTMINWSQQSSLPLHILLTKADKLGQNKAKQALQAVTRELSGASGISLQTFSSLKRRGIDEARQVITGWFTETRENGVVADR